MPTTKSILLGADAPRVLTVPMIAAVLANRRKLPARNTTVPLDSRTDRKRCAAAGHLVGYTSISLQGPYRPLLMPLASFAAVPS